MSDNGDGNFMGRYVRPLNYFDRIRNLERRANIQNEQSKMPRRDRHVSTANDATRPRASEGGSSAGAAGMGKYRLLRDEDFEKNSTSESEVEFDENETETSDVTQKAPENIRIASQPRAHSFNDLAADQHENQSSQAATPVQLRAVTQPSGSISSVQDQSEEWNNLVPRGNSTRNQSLGTSAANFNPIPCSVVSINKWMKQENWPHHKFTDVDDQGMRRQNWVNWAHGFKIACGLVGEMTHDQRKMIFLRQGGAHVWDIIGAGVETLSFSQMWDKVDRFYASTSDPAVHAAAYRVMSQKEGETVIHFITRLKKQAKLAEMSEEEEEKELRLALLERCKVSKDLRIHFKMSPSLDNMQLQALAHTIEPSDIHEASETKVHAIEYKPQRSGAVKRGVEQRSGNSKQFSSGRRCNSCGKAHEGKCEASSRDKLCFTCGKPGHFSKDCLSGSTANKKKPGANVHQVKTDDSDWD